MTRPQIVRADTLDLQSRERASAADHTGGSNSPRSAQGLAPHQSNAIRSVSEEQAQAKYDSEKAAGSGLQEEDEVDRDLAGSENLTGDEGGYDDDDDMGDRMSSSPSIADDDIDMNMVYALHTFQASVEGQANATKGEHMVLLDDTNSYWWLVKILRDSSIGYLPAEHIETPTERLARLNKHRNIDLASNMLSDTANEKSKNPLKKAMRRRNAKTVAFAPPTFVEASEYEYTTDEEEGENGYDSNEEEVAQESNESENVEAGVRVTKPASSLDDKVKDPKSTTEEGVKLRTNPTPSSLRHPDSAVFSDDKAETKKITLTPNLLRDDGMDTTSTSLKGRGSLDKDKSVMRDGITSPEPRGKDGKKGKKGVLGGLFKRRHRKGKKDDEDDLEDWLHSGTGPEKQSSISSRESEDSQIDVRREKGDAQRKQQEQQAQQQQAQQQQAQQQQAQQQQAQQQQAQQQQAQQQQAQQQQTQQQQQQQKQQQRELQQKPAASGAPSTIRKVEPDTEPKEEVAVHGPTTQQKQSLEVQRSGSGSKPTAVHSPDNRSLSQLSHSSETERGPPQEKTITVNSPTETQNLEPLVQSPQTRNHPTDSNNSAPKPAYQRSTYQPARSNGNQSPEQLSTPIERLSESPEQISYHDASDRHDLTDGTSSGDDTSSSPIESPPEIIERIDEVDSPTPAIANEEGGAITRTWSDWSLRTYFEDDNDVRDMLIVVQQDKSGAGVVRKDHPDIGPLFEDASTRLADITKRLDGMLGDWLQRKGRTR